AMFVQDFDERQRNRFFRCNPVWLIWLTLEPAIRIIRESGTVGPRFAREFEELARRYQEWTRTPPGQEFRTEAEQACGALFAQTGGGQHAPGSTPHRRQRGLVRRWPRRSWGHSSTLNRAGAGRFTRVESRSTGGRSTILHVLASFSSAPCLAPFGPSSSGKRVFSTIRLMTRARSRQSSEAPDGASCARASMRGRRSRQTAGAGSCFSFTLSAFTR